MNLETQTAITPDAEAYLDEAKLHGREDAVGHAGKLLLHCAEDVFVGTGRLQQSNSRRAPRDNHVLILTVNETSRLNMLSNSNHLYLPNLKS